MKQHSKLLFFVLFSILGLVTLQIPVNKLAGSNVSFTIFDFFGPIAGAFLGPLYAVASVAAVELINVFVHHQTLTTGGVIRLVPMLFAVYYFSLSKKDTKWILVVPILAILSFVLNPVGRTVWYYSLFWVIPVVAYFWKKHIVVRALGATFTAHAVGGAIWIWAFHLPASVWKGLIPVVIEERILFTLGIAASYVVIEYSLKFLVRKKILPALPSLSSM